MQRIIQSFFLLVLLLSATPSPLGAATVELPLFLRTQILQNALAESFTPEPGKPTVLFQQGSYNYLHISEPQLTIRDGQPYFSCNANASMGFDSLGILPSVVKWNGFVLMRLDFFVDPQWQLRYRILDSAIYNEKGGKPVVTGFAWDLSKRFLHPRLEQYGFDLAMPQKDISNLLRACASPADSAPLEAALNTLTVGTLRASTDGITVPLLLTVDNAQTKPVAPLPAEAPLGFEELEKIQQAFEPIDAFLVFTIKGLSTDLGDSLHQEQLFDLLITSRYQLLMILTGQAPVENRDPFRQLFIDVWEQLRPIVESSSGKSGLMQKKMLRYMTFINAGDALLTLDRTAPGLGIHLTSDGLRRLARMMQPDSKEDPLHFDWQIDPALRELFQFQPEPEPPPIEIIPPQPLPAVEPAVTPTVEPTGEPAVEPPTVPAAQPPATPPVEPVNQPAEPQAPSVSRALLNFFIGIAYAENLPATIQPTLYQRLNRWVPNDGDEAEYEQIMSQLLTALALEQIKRDNLTPQYTKIFLTLVPAVAMIESCWQHFELKNDKIVARRTQAGGLGIMQINQHVWRGFYNMDRLQGDVAYNIQAGNQILMRYFKQHAIKVAEEVNNPDIAARAAYAAYNGGPGAVRRFLKTGVNPRQKRIDDHLWELYQKISAGGSGDLTTCDIM
ncbi:MAG: transglycosylase SLT domain-containing protein [Desulfobulbaceae bacterium]|nr:transglycosylase SLT domain-containing protein [Desulfobulbaceae bacterium]